MARGRKGDGPETRAAKGNPGHRPSKAKSKAAKDTSNLPPVVEAMPPYLSADARRIWERAALPLARMGFFRSTDHEPMARYCENLLGWWNCQRRLRRRKGDPTYETASKHGKMLRLHPDFIAQNAYEKRLVALEDRLGLSPRARQEILRGLAAAPATLPFAQSEDPKPADETPTGEPVSPLGMLNRGTDVLQ